MTFIEKSFENGTYAAFAAFSADMDDVERHIRAQRGLQYFMCTSTGVYGVQYQSSEPCVDVHIYECEHFSGTFVISVHASSQRMAGLRLYELLRHPGVEGFRELEGADGHDIADKYVSVEERNFGSPSVQNRVA